MSGKVLRLLLLLVFAVGIGLRLVGIGDPIGARRAAAWREADMGAVARAFHREGLDPLRPRIEWRGDGPGYVESEVPVLSFVAGATYFAIGERDVVLRVLSALASAAALIAFAFVARRSLSPTAALAATALFAVSPLPVFLGNGAQPDGLMLLFLVLAFSALERWTTEGRPRALLLAATWLGAAILTKASAAHFGLVMAFAVVVRLGLPSALRSPRVWAAAAVALVPAVAWYAWSHHFWAEFGNSLGLSNETHAASLAVLVDPHTLFAIARKQLAHVVPIGGLLLVAVAVVRARQPVVLLSGAWLLAALVFHLFAANTSADEWAFYYHVLSTPAAALLMGAGVVAVASASARAGVWRAAIGLSFGLALTQYAALAVSKIKDRDPGGDLHRQRACAQAVLAPVVPKDALIVVEGGRATDDLGNPVAYDRPMVFYFMDRKGFTHPGGTLSVELLERLERRGAAYYVASQALLESGTGAARLVSERYGEAAGCEDFVLFDLKSPANHREWNREDAPQVASP